MIVDLMRNDIGRVAEPGSVRVPELFVVEPFPAVHHLVSTITAPARSRTACDLLRAVSGRLHHRRAKGAGDGDYR
jgi:para-aminobenzoate synthetase component 1